MRTMIVCLTHHITIMIKETRTITFNEWNSVFENWVYISINWRNQVILQGNNVAYVILNKLWYKWQRNVYCFK